MSTAYVQFVAYGTPQPKGSTRAFVRGGRAIVTSDNPKVKAWQNVVAKSAKLAYPQTTFDGAVSVFARFSLPHPTTGKRRLHHTTRPDLDKLLRAVGDSLSGVLWKDDAQIVNLEGTKEYADPGDPPRVVVLVTEVDR